MTKAQIDILFAAAVVAARDLPKDAPLRARLADAMRALLKTPPKEIA